MHDICVMPSAICAILQPALALCCSRPLQVRCCWQLWRFSCAGASATASRAPCCPKQLRQPPLLQAHSSQPSSSNSTGSGQQQAANILTMTTALRWCLQAVQLAALAMHSQRRLMPRSLPSLLMAEHRWFLALHLEQQRQHLAELHPAGVTRCTAAVLCSLKCAQTATWRGALRGAGAGGGGGAAPPQVIASECPIDAFAALCNFSTAFSSWCGASLSLSMHMTAYNKLCAAQCRCFRCGIPCYHPYFCNLPVMRCLRVRPLPQWLLAGASPALQHRQLQRQPAAQPRPKPVPPLAPLRPTPLGAALRPLCQHQRHDQCDGATGCCAAWLAADQQQDHAWPAGGSGRSGQQHRVGGAAGWVAACSSAVVVLGSCCVYCIVWLAVMLQWSRIVHACCSRALLCYTGACFCYNRLFGCTQAACSVVRGRLLTTAALCCFCCWLLVYAGAGSFGRVYK
jgi:hypothetical protein